MTGQAQSGSRNRSIDIARGIAIISIIFGHLSFDFIDKIVYTYHVPLFFILTGYFMKIEPVYAFIRKKMRTILAPYAFTCLVMVSLATLISAISRGDVFQTFKEWAWAAFYGSGGDYITPFYIKAIGAIWFLWASFWGTILMQMLLRCTPIRRALLVGILFLAGYYSAYKMFWFPLSIQAGFCSVLYMYIGYCFKQKEMGFKSLPKRGKAVIWIVVIFLWLLFIVRFKTFWLVQCDFGRGAIDILGSICGCACVLGISILIDCHIERLSPFLAACGRYSIVILCVHITELKLIHWKKIAVWLYGKGIPWIISGGIAIIPKLVFIAGVTWMIACHPKMRSIFIPNR